MGIHGIYKEIGSGVRVALSKLAVQKFEETGRPLRLAIDTPIWLFQIQASKGGTNPALRTFYYRLLRLMSLSVHPLFVFDGPQRPEFKRNKRVGGGRAQVSSIPEYLAKQLLKQFGFPFHLAPGEAEAECALLQKEGIVDAVLSEDVDTLMFGSGTSIKNWSPLETSKSKTPTHVDLYDAAATKRNSGLDPEGMILVALMSGGDYITGGIPGVGPKLACEAARAGFGADLCKIRRSDRTTLNAWRERLQYELRTNESKYFRTKHTAVTVPEDFPNMDVLAYYTHPVISSKEKLDRLRASLSWDMDMDYPSLRNFTAEAFSWTNLGGAKHFIRNMAGPVLVRELRLRGQSGDPAPFPANTAIPQGELVHSIHGRRTHVSTDNSPEMRVAVTPISLVPINLDAEEPDDAPLIDEDAEDAAMGDELDDITEASSRARQPTKYNPTALEKLWVMETFVKAGAPHKLREWEASDREAKARAAAKEANKVAGKSRSRLAKTGGMQVGALDRFARTMKPGIERSAPPKDSLGIPPATTVLSDGAQTSTSGEIEHISLLSSPTMPAAQDFLAQSDLQPPVPKRRRESPLRRAQTSPASLFHVGAAPRPTNGSGLSAVEIGEVDLTTAWSPTDVHFSPSQTLPTKKARTTSSDPAVEARQGASGAEPIRLDSSPPRTLDTWIRRSQSNTPQKTMDDPTREQTLLSPVEGPPSEITHLEIRTARIAENLDVTRAAVAQIDLTSLGSPKSKRTFPKPMSHMTPADVAKMGRSFEKDTSHLRRRWDKYPALTETSGNQPPVPQAVPVPGIPALSMRHNSTREESCLVQSTASKVKKTCVQVGTVADGFWEEDSAASAPRRIPRRPALAAKAVQVWAMDDLSIVDLTRGQ